MRRSCDFVAMNGVCINQEVQGEVQPDPSPGGLGVWWDQRGPSSSTPRADPYVQMSQGSRLHPCRERQESAVKLLYQLLDHHMKVQGKLLLTYTSRCIHLASTSESEGLGAFGRL
ncbi:unnamed protein product [Natator depressus]